MGKSISDISSEINALSSIPEKVNYIKKSTNKEFLSKTKLFYFEKRNPQDRQGRRVTFACKLENLLSLIVNESNNVGQAEVIQEILKYFNKSPEKLYKLVTRPMGRLFLDKKIIDDRNYDLVEEDTIVGMYIRNLSTLKIMNKNDESSVIHKKNLKQMCELLTRETFLENILKTRKLLFRSTMNAEFQINALQTAEQVWGTTEKVDTIQRENFFSPWLSCGFEKPLTPDHIKINENTVDQNLLNFLFPPHNSEYFAPEMSRESAGLYCQSCGLKTRLKHIEINS